jgi:hypothetical protein
LQVGDSFLQSCSLLRHLGQLLLPVAAAAHRLGDVLLLCLQPQLECGGPGFQGRPIRRPCLRTRVGALPGALIRAVAAVCTCGRVLVNVWTLWVWRGCNFRTQVFPSFSSERLGV